MSKEDNGKEMALEDISILETPAKNFENDPARLALEFNKIQLKFNTPMSGGKLKKTPSIMDLNDGQSAKFVQEKVSSPSKINPFSLNKAVSGQEPSGSLKCSPIKPSEEQQLFLTPQKVFPAPRKCVP